jgi:hypothetical protein
MSNITTFKQRSYRYSQKSWGGVACKMGVAGYNDTEVNRPPEAVSDWSVPSHFEGFCKWLKSKAGRRPEIRSTKLEIRNKGT